MARFEKGNKIGNRFSSENQPKNPGRKPALYTQLKKITGKQVKHELSREDYYKVIRYLMERTPGELAKIVQNAKDNTNGETPVWVINIISAINSDIRYGRTTTIDSIFDRLFGKASQPIEGDVQVTNNSVDLSVFSDEELLQYHALLEKLKNGNKE